MQQLPAFLDRTWRTPFAWGKLDCILFLADWSIERLATDPAAAYRGRYSTAAGAERIIRRAGGLTALVDLEFGAAGWAPVEAAAPGDIGVVHALTSSGPNLTGALFSGDRWVGLKPGGLIAGPATPAQVWSPAWKL